MRRDFAWVCVRLHEPKKSLCLVTLVHQPVPQSWHFRDAWFPPDSNSCHDTTSITNCYHNYRDRQRPSLECLGRGLHPPDVLSLSLSLSCVCSSCFLSPSVYTLIPHRVWRGKGSGGLIIQTATPVSGVSLYMPSAHFQVYVLTSSYLLCVCVCRIWFVTCPKRRRNQERNLGHLYSVWICVSVCSWRLKRFLAIAIFVIA